ncbi:hypothetical protein BDN71DRAFT_978852 [Pleurotus eryngii]|uniref:Uncharacterized protein n=1 Tax=Pleurotus eryngii TaxID=5323 RepID=A0A9P5ZY53_PLEER|nr:hypothetical protein BDN71DRAFT_978852 [Pleurotus eryngii]
MSQRPPVEERRSTHRSPRRPLSTCGIILPTPAPTLVQDENSRVLCEVVAIDLIEHWSPGHDISLKQWKGQGEMKEEVEGKEEDGESGKRKRGFMYPPPPPRHILLLTLLFSNNSDSLSSRPSRGRVSSSILDASLRSYQAFGEMSALRFWGSGLWRRHIA